MLPNAFLAAALAATLPLLPYQDDTPPSGTGPGPTLRVFGEAEVGADPDLAVVSLGASAQAQNAADAQRQVNERMQAVLGAIEELGIPEQGLRTSGISLQPVYSDSRSSHAGDPAAPTIVGYRASDTVRVEFGDPAGVGRVIDAGIAAGANQLQGISFELRDDSAQRSQALVQAVADARAKAGALAGAAELELVSLLQVEEGQVQSFAPVQMARAAAFDAGTPVRPGQVRVQASVTLTYRVAPTQGAQGGR